MMAMEQQKRVAALSGGTGGMMFSGSLPPPQSHKVLIIVCSVYATVSSVYIMISYYELSLLITVASDD